MAKQASAAKIREGLKDVVASGVLPSNLQPKAEALLTTLDKPIRLTVMGFPGAGKSQMMNLLAGADVIPNGLHLPTTQLVYGDTPQSKCTMSDGSVKVFDHVDAVAIAELAPVFVEFAMPLAALRRISVLEVVASDDAVEQQRAMSWAAKRSEVTLWCTQYFNVPEQTLWSAMPDLVKDHAFMVVTKADILSRNDLLEGTLVNLKDVAEHEFNQILPIATPAAIDARMPDGTVDKDAIRRSGGGALISAILRQVELGQQATLDQASMILRQHAQAAAATPARIEIPAKVETPKKAETTRVVEVPKTKPVVAAQTPVVKPAPVSRPISTAIQSNAKVGDEFPEPLAPKKKAPAARLTLNPGSKKTYEDAIAYLTKEGKALAKEAEAAETPPVAKIMSRSVDNVQWLADHLQDNGDDDDPILERARDAAIDAADLIQLMQLEKRDSAVFDAVSLVLQLKHELEADLAA